MRKQKVTIVDPPEGWKYGFPKPLPWYHNKMDFYLRDWLVHNGYPSHLLDLAEKYSKYWEVEI